MDGPQAATSQMSDSVSPAQRIPPSALHPVGVGKTDAHIRNSSISQGKHDMGERNKISVPYFKT